MRIPVLAAGAILLLAAACGGSGATNAPGPTATTPPAATATAAGGQPTGAPTTPPAATTTIAATGCSGTGAGTAVAVVDFAFDPASVTVAVGGEVTWTNADSATHTVTFDNGPDCGRMGNGAEASRTFDTAGTFAYHCAIHASMKGTVIVE